MIYTRMAIIYLVVIGTGFGLTIFIPSEVLAYLMFGTFFLTFGYLLIRLSEWVFDKIYGEEDEV